MKSRTNSLALFEQLYADTCVSIFRFFVARVPHGELAEDLTSETYLKAAANWPPRVLTGEAPKSWLFAIARNLLKDHYRAADRRTFVQLNDEVAGQPYWGLGGQRHIEILSVKIAFPTLSARDRAVLSLRLAGLSNREIGDTLDMTESAAAMACLRAQRRLQKKLKHAER
jgi:RNA polymerase sigma-70 factor (ECF subfamily)